MRNCGAKQSLNRLFSMQFLLKLSILHYILQVNVVLLKFVAFACFVDMSAHSCT